MQVDPINPKLKQPGIKRLKLKCDELLSSFAFKFNLRRYNEGRGREGRGGAHAAQHGRAVQLDPIKPKMKPPGIKRSKLKCDMLLSTSAFKFSLRRYSTGTAATTTWCRRCGWETAWWGGAG